MNNAEVLIKFKGDTTDADSKTQKMTTSIDGLTKSFTLASLAAQGVSKAIQVFNQNLDSAISRVDTMNNFPKVMSNLGISAEDSAEVIDDLGKKLQGLPTSLDAAAMSVQRLTSKNGDVKKSEQLFLALNNAILAGGGSAQVQTTALEQISQAYAKGKPDMMEWRTLMTAMPAQLKQVAQAMGYTDAAMLGEAVRAKDGEKEFARMMETMMKMNTEGVNGFKSFDEQARNATGGISTSVTNMKTAIVRGIANMLNSLNASLEPFGGLSGVLTKIGKVGEKVFTAIGNAIKVAVPYLISFGKWVKKNQAWLKPLVVVLVTFIATFKTMKTIIAIIDAVKLAIAALNAIMLANPIVLIVAAIAALVAGFIYLWNNCEAFRQFWINLWNNIKSIVSSVVNGIISFFASIPETISSIIESIIAFIKKIPDYLIYAFGYVVGLVTGFIARLWQFIYSDIPAFFLEVLSKIAEFFVNIGKALWNFITVTIPNFISNMIAKLKQVPGKVWEAVKAAPGKIAEAFINGITKVKDAVKKIFNAIWDGLKELPKKMISLGKEIVKGLWNGIKSMAGWMKDKIKGFGKGVVDGFKSVFDIHSPSVLFKKEIGINIGLGVIEGIDATKKDIDKAISGVASDVSAGLNASISSTTISSIQGSNITPITNVYISQKQDPLGRMVQDVKTFSGGAKQDYLYGR